MIIVWPITTCYNRRGVHFEYRVRSGFLRLWGFFILIMAILNPCRKKYYNNKDTTNNQAKFTGENRREANCHLYPGHRWKKEKNGGGIVVLVLLGD